MRIEQAARSDREFLGLTSGLRDLDAATGGWQPGNLVVLAARPVIGNSSVALNFATHAAFAEGAAVLFCSLEMSTSETVQRYLSTETNIPGRRAPMTASRRGVGVAADRPRRAVPARPRGGRRGLADCRGCACSARAGHVTADPGWTARFARQPAQDEPPRRVWDA